MNISPLRFLAATFLAAVSFAPVPTLAQQDYIGRYDLYTGYAVFDSPALGLNEHNGFHTQAGINMRRWLSLGGDYSVASGHEILTTNLLPAALQAQINA